MCHTCSSSTRSRWGCAPQRKSESTQLANTYHSQRWGEIPLLAPIFLAGPQLLGVSAPLHKARLGVTAGWVQEGLLCRCLWKDSSRWDVRHICLVSSMLPGCPGPRGGGGYAQLMCPLPQGNALSHLYVCFPLGLGAEGSAGCAPWLPAAAMSMYHPMAPRW